MEKSKKFQKGKIETGKLGYLNENCWLVRTLNYAPYKRCQYCKLKFHNCLFLHYQIVSLILILFFLTLSFLIEGRISKLMIISIFTLVIVYGYFFNKSTEKIIKANFAQRKTKEALEELNEKLEEKVDEQTKELRRAYEDLKKLDKTKTEFISIASHQLRTPLSAIKGYVSLVLEEHYGKLPKKLKEKLNNVYLSNERLIKLVNNLLTISRIEMGRLTIEKASCQIEDLIESSVKEMEITANKKGLRLLFIKSKIHLPKIKIDSSKIRQVILNLIDNAIKYTKQGKIEIKIKEIKIFKISKIQISIKDTGEGLTREEQKTIFDSFTRGKTSATFFVEGAGLGLHVAKKYVELHKGKIWAQSSGKNKGSTFYIELPIN